MNNERKTRFKDRAVRNARFFFIITGILRNELQKKASVYLLFCANMQKIEL